MVRDWSMAEAQGSDSTQVAETALSGTAGPAPDPLPAHVPQSEVSFAEVGGTAT